MPDCTVWLHLLLNLITNWNALADFAHLDGKTSSSMAMGKMRKNMWQLLQKDRSQWVCIKMALFNQQKHSCVTACVLDAIFSIAAKNARSLRFTAIDTLCVAVVLSGIRFHDVKSCSKFLTKNYLVKSVVLNWFCFRIPDLNTKNWSNCQDYQQIDQKNLKYLY